MSTGRRWIAVGAGVAAAGVLIGIYIGFLTGGPTPYRVPVAQGASGKVVQLELMTVAAIGPKLSPNANWVSYLVREHGVWRRSTVWTLPAHATVHVTIYNFDGRSGLRNPFLAQARGVDGGTFRIDGGPPQTTIKPDDASHTFAIPQLGVIVPIYGVADDAKDQCGFAPCPMSNAHETITFTFHTGKKGHYRWQCFVPCAAGFVYGFGGPMQTIGYMDGYVDVV
ncbi:MAG TPA: hypothetical protein VFA82_02245 [Gaiellaceae bacterium]|nr:hypothetical protein [Gaiellaceae bacterium]